MAATARTRRPRSGCSTRAATAASMRSLSRVRLPSRTSSRWPPNAARSKTRCATRAYSAVVPVCVGPVTQEAAIRHGLGTAVAPVRPVLGAMVSSIVGALTPKPHVGDPARPGSGTRWDGCHRQRSRVELTPREAAVLGVLARKPGAVVSKPTLLRDGVGHQRRRRPRAGNGDQPSAQGGWARQHVKTVVRRGYMLGG